MAQNGSVWPPGAYPSPKVMVGFQPHSTRLTLPTSTLQTLFMLFLILKILSESGMKCKVTGKLCK